MLEIVPSNQFRKDLKLAKKRGLKMEHLRDVVNTLASGQKLADKYRDHGLTGDYQGFRECHVEPDWLLVAHIDEFAVLHCKGRSHRIALIRCEDFRIFDDPVCFHAFLLSLRCSAVCCSLR